MRTQFQLQPQETFSEQKCRNAYCNLNILQSKHYKLYSQINLKFRKNNILDYQLATLSHSKRKRTNEKLMFMQFLRDSKTLMLGYDKSSERGDINFIDTSEPKINDFYYNKLQGGFGGAAVFKDGRYIIVSDKKGNFTFIDVLQGPNIDDIKNKTIQTTLQGVLDICLSPAQNCLALGMSDRRCLIIDIQSQRLQKLFPVNKKIDKHAYGVNAIDWHPYKSLIISSSLDINDTLKLWDPHTQQLIYDANFHKNSIITHCQFHPEGNTYFSFGKDNKILQYQLRYKGILNQYYLQSQPTSMAIMNTGQLIVGDTMGHTVWFDKFGKVIKSQKGASAVVALSIQQSSNVLVVARQRQHMFEIITKQKIFQLNDY